MSGLRDWMGSGEEPRQRAKSDVKVRPISLLSRPSTHLMCIHRSPQRSRAHCDCKRLPDDFDLRPKCCGSIVFRAKFNPCGNTYGEFSQSGPKTSRYACLGAVRDAGVGSARTEGILSFSTVWVSSEPLISTQKAAANMSKVYLSGRDRVTTAREGRGDWKRYGALVRYVPTPGQARY